MNGFALQMDIHVKFIDDDWEKNATSIVHKKSCYHENDVSVHTKTICGFALPLWTFMPNLKGTGEEMQPVKCLQLQ